MDPIDWQARCAALEKELSLQQQRASQAEVDLAKAQRLVLKIKADRDAWIDKASVAQPALVPQTKKERPSTDQAELSKPQHDSSESIPLVKLPAEISEPTERPAAADPPAPKNNKRSRSVSPAKKALKQARANSNAPIYSNGTLTKPKRAKTGLAHKPAAKIPIIQRDALGRPVLPLTNGVYTLHRLGEVVSLPDYHTERYIYPVGFETSRSFLSMLDPQRATNYYCRILKGEDGPIFEIEPEDDPENKVRAGSATGAWAQIFKIAHKLRGKSHSNSVSGPDQYGLNQPLFKALIQELPGASDLETYVSQKFVASPAKERRTRVPLPSKKQTDSIPQRRSVTPLAQSPPAPHPDDPFAFLPSGSASMESESTPFFGDTLPFNQSYPSDTPGYSASTQTYTTQPFADLLPLDPDSLFPSSCRGSFDEWAHSQSYATSESDLFDPYQLPANVDSLTHDFPFIQS